MGHAETTLGVEEIASTNRIVLVGLGIIALLYAGSLIGGWPQSATARLVEHLDAAPHAEHHEAVLKGVPPVVTIVPFVLLLSAIAVLPLISTTSHWWENNRNRFIVSATLGAMALLYYLTLHTGPVERHFVHHAVVHSADGGLSWHLVWVVLQNAILNEYVPFITLLFALFTISGGIRIDGDLPAHALTNTVFLAIGGALASFIGTTGAAMLLIRPLLDTNRERKHVAHTVVFFIFVVCNCGGCLTPLGDPPLFLGYLQGVPFLWTTGLWKQWLLVNSLLLGIYFLWDHFLAYPKESRADIALDETQTRRLRFSGVALNSVLLAVLILAVALLDPSTPLPGTQWHPWLYLREIVLLALVAASLGFGSTATRVANRFNYSPIIEVAVLFIGIFICMQPALQILDSWGPELGVDTARRFFWATGSLSSVLDNAPTYLVFFETARSLSSEGGKAVAGVQESHLIAISLGAVFMGAMTYIGNGPNFMVKAVAESYGIKMPSFFAYLLYSCGILLPILILISLVGV